MNAQAGTIHRFGASLAATIASAALVAPAHAQCTNCASGTRVNDDYTANVVGQYKMIRNLGNFRVIAQGGGRNRIPMADPAILKIDSTYYVTGTSDGANNRNLAIYRSTNLVDWYPHMLAFWDNGAADANYTKVMEGPFPVSPADTDFHTIINGRVFSDFWAPQLYIDPASPNTVWLSFTVAEHKSDGCGGWSYDMRSIQCASISKSDFLIGGSFRRFATGASEPLRYGYQVNNGAGAIKYDGGEAQGHGIPTSGDPALYYPCRGPNAGEVMKYGYGYGFAGWGGAAGFMALDSFVYFDPKDSGKRWMLYTWQANEVTDNGVNGNHVAAYPMRTNSLMDAFGSILPIAYRYHWNYWPPTTDTCAAPPGPVPPAGWLLNGVSGRDGKRIVTCQPAQPGPPPVPAVPAQNYGVAEGPAAFERSDRTYVLFSRNAFDSPAYGIFYRVGPGANMSQMYLRDGANNLSWTDPFYGEGPVVWSVNRGQVDGPSYGHGEVFKGPTVVGEPQRYYLIYHAKEGAPFTTPYSHRTVYFKELRFDGDGYITSFSNNAAWDETDADVFLIPN